MKGDSIGVFIDGDYLDGVLRAEFESARIDFMTFSQLIIPEGHHRFRTYYYKSVPYIGVDSTDEDRQRADGIDKFLQSLRHLPRFKVRTGELYKSGDGQFRRKGVNVSMAVDITRLITERVLGQVFIVCGDPDMLPLFKAIRDMGMIVRMYHGENVPERMLAEADEPVRIDRDLIDRCRREQPDRT